jgi:1-hydroxycarotenoid 3,4-desaturase
MVEVNGLRECHVVVVGAGVGGLVSALLLAHQGVRVTLVESGAEPGGKMRRIMVGGVPVDSGPTVFTMRWVFDQIFDQAGCSLESLVSLAPLDILARHAWRRGDRRLDLFADPARSADEISKFSSPAEAARFLDFCKKAKEIYQHLEGPYIRSSRPTLAGIAADLGVAGVASLASLGPLASLWKSLGNYFHDPRLRQLFGRYATYCGASPWEAPATLMLVAHVELDGVWSVSGGMHTLARVLAEQAVQRGAHMRYSTSCKRMLVRDGRVRGVELADGEQLACDAVVFNGDACALAQGLLGDDVRLAAFDTPLARKSLSALTWSVHGRAKGFPLVRHNVFFDDDYAREFSEIFKGRRLPSRGTVYVCAQDRCDTAADPGQNERLLCLVNAPAFDNRSHGKLLNAMEIQSCEEQSLKLLGQCGLDLDLTSAQTVRTTPSDFNRLFPGTGGALYGPASHGWMTPFQRPGSASRLPGLYLAGGSVHPGPGVPMAALSGQLAAATVMADLASTRRSGRVRISGGMSMRSATTASTR